MQKVAVLLLCVWGCVHRSPEEPILRALADHARLSRFPGESTPQNVRFRDDLTARIFRDLVRSGVYRIVPKGQPLFCPGVLDTPNHGYLLGVGVIAVSGDSAVATVSQMCTAFSATCAIGHNCGFMGNAIDYETQYLLRKVNKRWKVVRPLGTAVAIPG
ncbi:MAG: hypothetical protein ACJ78K_01255 [Gemmatimonadaceae bacterium]